MTNTWSLDIKFSTHRQCSSCLINYLSELPKKQKQTWTWMPNSRTCRPNVEGVSYKFHSRDTPIKPSKTRPKNSSASPIVFHHRYNIVTHGLPTHPKVKPPKKDKWRATQPHPHHMFQVNTPYTLYRVNIFTLHNYLGTRKSPMTPDLRKAFILR